MIHKAAFVLSPEEFEKVAKAKWGVLIHVRKEIAEPLKVGDPVRLRHSRLPLGMDGEIYGYWRYQDGTYFVDGFTGFYVQPWEIRHPKAKGVKTDWL